MSARIGFAVTPAGVVVELILSQAVSDAHGILTADGMSAEKAADLAVGAERQGMDPVAFARKTVRLRRSLRH